MARLRGKTMNDQENRAATPLDRLKMVLLAVATLPFAMKVVYLNRAWVSSPVDRARIGLWGTAALFVTVVALLAKLVKRFPTEKTLRESRAMKALPMALIMYGVGLLLDLNAVQLVASVGILWTTAWALYGRVSGLMLAPAALCAVLAVPGSSYWLSKASNEFVAPVMPAYTPVFKYNTQEGFLGREVPPNASFKRFFRTSEAHQFRYASLSNEVSVLAVQVGVDIHEIHPATHCLRSSGWSILSEDLYDVVLPGREKPLSVTEAFVQGKGGVNRLMWVWYSSDEKSTGSFIRFRRMFSKDVPWRTYQLTTVVTGPESVAAAREVLANFLLSGQSAG